ncbi:hypothetical protein CPC08DRAFT_713519 [Agrocybe pediades]|nr:hypothetical protein CPC08DRAFT_713519 [Agrocybe pediades]
MPVFTESEFQILESFMKTSDPQLRDFKVMYMGLPPDLVNHTYFSANNIRKWAFAFDLYVKFVQAQSKEATEQHPQPVPPKVVKAYNTSGGIDGRPVPRLVELEASGAARTQEQETPLRKRYFAQIVPFSPPPPAYSPITRHRAQLAAAAAAAAVASPTPTPTTPSTASDSPITRSRARLAAAAAATTPSPITRSRARLLATQTSEAGDPTITRKSASTRSYSSAGAGNRSRTRINKRPRRSLADDFRAMRDGESRPGAACSSSESASAPVRAAPASPAPMRAALPPSSPPYVLMKINPKDKVMVDISHLCNTP